MSRRLLGPVVAVGTVAAVGAPMFPLRAHLSVATTALVLVIPVVAAVAAGGFPAGVVAVAAGFLVYDFVFIPPYYTLSVGAGQNWVALGVYVVVMLLVAQVVARLDLARTRAQRREEEARRLFEMSELLVGDRSLGDLLEAIVVTVRDAFGLEGVALLLPVDGRLQPVSSAGTPMSEDELARMGPGAPPVSMTTSAGRAGLQTVALSASGRPVGLLVLHGGPAAPADAAVTRPGTLGGSARLLDGQLGGGVGLQSLVGNRVAAADGPSVGARRQAFLRPADRRQAGLDTADDGVVRRLGCQRLGAVAEAGGLVSRRPVLICRLAAIVEELLQADLLLL